MANVGERGDNGQWTALGHSGRKIRLCNIRRIVVWGYRLAFGIVCYGVMVAQSRRLGWTPFVDPIDQKNITRGPAMRSNGRFKTIFVLTQNPGWVPLHGYLGSIDSVPRVIDQLGAGQFSLARRGSYNSYADFAIPAFMLGL